MLNAVQPVLKVGHSENQERPAAHLNTTSSCLTHDELLVVSDLDEVVHGHRTVDVLADLLVGYISSPEACEQYCLQQERSLQWTWRGGDEKGCIPMSSIRYGLPRTPEYMDQGGEREPIPPGCPGRKDEQAVGRLQEQLDAGSHQGVERRNRRCEE
ncbi:hypothetical protein E4U43_006842, partial [Claviceps pusilla]